MVLCLGQTGGIVVVKTAGIDGNLIGGVDFVVDAEEEVATASAVDVQLGVLGRPSGVVLALYLGIATLVGGCHIRVATRIITP